MAATKTPDKTQKQIINLYRAALETSGVKVGPPSGRFGPNLRIMSAGDPAKLLNAISPCTLTPTDVVRSGQFATLVLTLLKDFGPAKKGDQCYFVQSVRSTGEIRNKSLTPDALGMGGKTINKSLFERVAIEGIGKSKDVNENIKAFLYSLLDASKGNGQIKAKQIESISDSDLNVIAKDFGEISGALWYMSNENKSTKAIEFPSASNARLVDYYAVEGNKKIAISAKANEGAPPSIEAIAEILLTKKYGSPAKDGARKAIISIAQSSVIEGIVKASMDLKTKGYQWMKTKVFRRDWKAADVEAMLAKYKSPKQFLAEFAPFYALIGRTASEKTTDEIFKQKAKRNGLILSPMGYSLVDEMNGNKVFLEVLTDAAQQIKVSQLYIKISKATKRVDYHIKEFDSSKFEFKYNSNAKSPSLKKISFIIAK
jgi:hypothetical protein